MEDDAAQDLDRFTEAQQHHYAAACEELAAGCKQTHWMWFIFPQLRGLGHSAMAQRYGIASAAEAVAYWRHPLLGPRLKVCTGHMLAVPVKSAHAILGAPDDLKFRSCMTLFAQAVPDEPLFARALARFFDGQPDQRTLALLAEAGPGPVGVRTA